MIQRLSKRKPGRGGDGDGEDPRDDGGAFAC